jgi:RecB family exonuclease
MTPDVLSGPPALVALQRVSPSRFLSLQECALREVWTAAGVPNQLPVAPAARLGSAIHRLLEEAGKGVFRERGRPAIATRCDELIEESESAMQASWLERHLLPLKNAVPDFEVRKLRAIERAQEITASLPAPVAVPSDRLPRGSEVWVSTPDGIAGGYVDRVEDSALGPVLRDYKTGHILEEASGQRPAPVKEAYEVQLKLYAAIYASMTGIWPARLELVPLRGPVCEVPFAVGECQALLRQARDVVLSINSTVANYSAREAQLRLASPSPRSCRYCPFRPSCAAYKDARRQAPAQDSWPGDLWGTVREKHLMGNGKTLLSIEQGAPGLPPATIRGLTPGAERHPALAYLQPGHGVAIFGLKTGSPGETFQESAWTVIYHMQEGVGLP